MRRSLPTPQTFSDQDNAAMVKKTVIKINAKRTKIAKCIKEKVRDHAKIINDCNVRLETEPVNTPDYAKVQSWREDAFHGLHSGITSLPYPLGQLSTLVEKLESELRDKPTKSTPELLNFIAANKRFIAVVRDLHDRKKVLLNDAEAENLWENIQF
jgi:hypothetical protein